MKFSSTRSRDKEITFGKAIFQGLAPDGGLYHPTSIPDLKELFAGFSGSTSYNELTEKVTYELLKEELNKEAVKRIINSAYSFSPFLRRLDDNLLILELFHGSSYAFKDFGACFLAASMEEYLSLNTKRAVILVATSGDTGSAVAQAFYKKKNIDVVILYPSGRVSNLQEKQLTTLQENIIALEVKGSFDDCQKIVKQAFVDQDLINNINLTSANSINLGRLMPQAFYYIYAYAQIKNQLKDDLYFTVPSGNFGNLTAGIYAWQWGLPAKGFVAATNVNDVVPEYLNEGIYTPRASVATFSNAMDVGNPSNFERMQTIFNNSHDKMKSIIHGEVVTDNETLDTIKLVKEKHDIFIDPHTAVGILSAKKFLKETGNDKQIIILSTAHAAKFPETVEKATGMEMQLPEGLKKTLTLEKHSIPVENSLSDLKEYLLGNY